MISRTPNPTDAQVREAIAYLDPDHECRFCGACLMTLPAAGRIEMHWRGECIGQIAPPSFWPYMIKET